MVPTSAVLTFRGWTEKDSDLAFSLWGDPRVVPDGTRDTAIARMRYEMKHQHDFRVQCWATFVSNADQRLLGAVGLRRRQDGVYSLEVQLSPDYGCCTSDGVLWGRCNYSRELALQVVAHAFGALKLEVIAGHHHPADNSAGQVLTKLGFLPCCDDSEAGSVYTLTSSRWAEQRASRLGIASPPQSLLHGLPEGRLFATHSSSQCVYGEWGWMCLAYPVVALRLCKSPPCGNGLKSAYGVFMIEYLGTAEDLPAPGEVTELLRRYARALAPRDIKLRESDDELQVSLLRLSRGRLALHSHEPAPPLSLRAVDCWCLVRATTLCGREFFFLPNHLHLRAVAHTVSKAGLVVDPELLGPLPEEPPEVGEILAMKWLQEVESCHHVASTPSRIEWLQRQWYKSFM